MWVLFLNNDGTVESHQKISETQGGFGGVLDDGDLFGSSVTLLGDLDGDGAGDLAVGARRDDDGGGSFGDRGAVWVLFLSSDGTVKSEQKISDTQGGFVGILDEDDYFGYSVSALGDLDGDDVGDLAVGAIWDDDGGNQRGAVWVLFLDGAECETPLDCDDDVGCTDDDCVDLACVSTANDANCDDGLFCNGAETCTDNACTAGDPACQEGQDCDEAEQLCTEPEDTCGAGLGCTMQSPAMALTLFALLALRVSSRKRRRWNIRSASADSRGIQQPRW